LTELMPSAEPANVVTLADPCSGSQNLAHIGRAADGLAEDSADLVVEVRVLGKGVIAPG